MAARLRSYKPGKYGKGTIPDEEHPEAQIWRVAGGWDGDPHHDDVSEALGIDRPMVTFHIDRAGKFYFHHSGDGHVKPSDPARLAAAVVRQHPELTWGRQSAERHQASAKTLAMNGRPLRPFEQGAHLHVLDWTHSTVRHRFQEAGQVQVKAAAKSIVAGNHAQAPELPSLEAAITGELRKLFALGHATVRSELDHQANGSALPIGLSAAPAPPNLRQAKARKGFFAHCANCTMFDAGTCWGYGNYAVKPNQLCDSYERDPKVKTLALSDAQRDPGRLRARARLVASSVAHQIWQAVQRARLQGITDERRLRQIGRDAGAAALRQAASNHAGGAINAGRHAAALTVVPGGSGGEKPAARVIGARYTSVLDKSTCGPCADADDGMLRSLEDPALVHPPNPACLGGDKCRCILVYQLSSEQGRPDVRPVAAVGVGSS